MRNSAEVALETRERIVTAGVAQSSGDGLGGITLGSLAETLGMSKAGVVGPFGSRQELQLAVVAKVGEMFTGAVVEPGLHRPAGLPRLKTVVDHWCSYLADGPFPNGCFMTAASCEVDGQPGELRNAVQHLVRQWRGFLRELVVTAQTAGELRDDVDPDDLVSALNGFAMSANQEIQLLGDRGAGRRAKRLMLAHVDASAPRSSPTT
ncbi:TetR/AcrR family transcriptional regulator [Mycobacterium paraterrae]|uniref:TetR/AcrR family transcriptional regulator n=1 Tax=Mycobacterium paraterrae TaxID=577492 RepID=A0ABY3VDT0_9MYCO|nr:TetR/AcrR family transcriptional regulator [Mycobacterium paraterrae]UMB67601.1 TetR/AcrR family transcriptional regulator [Mycobacterium paraterrae]